MARKLFATEEQKADISLPHNCLKKQNILKSKQFSLGFSTITQKIHTKHFSFLIAQSKAYTQAVGIIIGKKKVKLAVQRNLCRRLIKEGFRKNQPLFEHQYIIAIANKYAAKASKGELWTSIEVFLNTVRK